MKTPLICLFLLIFATISGQPSKKATILLKDGKKIEASHFGKLICESNRYAPTYTILRGKYSGSHTEISDYNDISKLVLSGFTESPVASKGNQKGTITVIKRSGVSVVLDEAELAMSCFGPGDRYNEIHVQIVNPLTEKAVDVAVEMNNIDSIVF
jgi:hypothetical protein